VHWKTALSANQVVLKGNVSPEDVTISVPATTVPGETHAFVLVGNDGQGNTAQAIITLQALVAPTTAVQKVTNGCTEQLTVGADTMFAFNQAMLTPGAQKTLAILGPAIARAGKHPIQINGYTDSIGSDAYNQVLSLQRARSVADWLEAHHYVSSPTAVKGLGKQNPVAPNTYADGRDNPEGRAKNRRVEVLIDTCKSVTR
jgi:outer membrane protein OmpA-like peptidoglycan-associated protein